MNRKLALAIIAGLLAGAGAGSPGWAQGNNPRPGGAASGGAAPAANGPANAPAVNAPAANGPAANAPVAAPAAGASRNVSVRVPGGGEYTVFIKEAPGALKSITEKGDLEVPSGTKSFTVYVLDKRSGYAGRKTVDAAAIPAELAFTSADFRLLQRVEVVVTGKGDLPISQGLITLTDGGKNAIQKPVLPSSQGRAAFDFVVGGEGTVAVTPEGGSSTTKTVRLELAPGQSSQTVAIGLPEVTAVVAAPAGTNAPEATGNAPAVSAPAANAPAAPAPVAPATAPATTPAATTPGAGPMEAFGNFIFFVFQWLFLIAVLAGLYFFAKKRGITVETVMKKLGVQPDAVAAGGGSLAGANLATGVPGPGAPPPPPPVVADPNQCQFCGQVKDASGGCACSALPSRGNGGGSYGGAAASASGAGPRLVGMQGIYMGTVFPISGAATLGREPANGIPLDRDTTTSRRHAEILADTGNYRIRDLGSANGTFVNGGRISTETPLSPGDEVSVGGTRFRFEV